MRNSFRLGAQRVAQRCPEEWNLTNLTSPQCPARLVEAAGPCRADENFRECERTGGELIVDLPSKQRFGRLLVGVVGVEVRDEDDGWRGMVLRRGRRGGLAEPAARIALAYDETSAAEDDHAPVLKVWPLPVSERQTGGAGPAAAPWRTPTR